MCVSSVEASLPPMSPVRPSTGTMRHSIFGEVPIGLASGRPRFNMPGGPLPTTLQHISLSPYTHSPLVPRPPSSRGSWGFALSSPTAVQGEIRSPVASSHYEKTGDKIDRTSAWGYWDRWSVASESPVSLKTNDKERSRTCSNSLFTG